jgi:hypothetical protein
MAQDRDRRCGSDPDDRIQGIYCKKYTLKEWWQALSEFNRRRLVSVPIMIDADAKAWWVEQKQLGNLSELGSDYAYSDFTDGSGNVLDIISAFGPVTSVTRKVGELARLIRKHLEGHVLVKALPVVGPSRH